MLTMCWSSENVKEISTKDDFVLTVLSNQYAICMSIEILLLNSEKVSLVTLIASFGVALPPRV